MRPNKGELIRNNRLYTTKLKPSQKIKTSFIVSRHFNRDSQEQRDVAAVRLARDKTHGSYFVSGSGTLNKTMHVNSVDTI